MSKKNILKPKHGFYKYIQGLFLICKYLFIFTISNLLFSYINLEYYNPNRINMFYFLHHILQFSNVLFVILILITSIKMLVGLVVERKKINKKQMNLLILFHILFMIGIIIIDFLFLLNKLNIIGILLNFDLLKDVSILLLVFNVFSLKILFDLLKDEEIKVDFKYNHEKSLMGLIECLIGIIVSLILIVLFNSKLFEIERHIIEIVFLFSQFPLLWGMKLIKSTFKKKKIIFHSKPKFPKKEDYSKSHFNGLEYSASVSIARLGESMRKLGMWFFILIFTAILLLPVLIFISMLLVFSQSLKKASFENKNLDLKNAHKNFKDFLTFTFSSPIIFIPIFFIMMSYFDMDPFYHGYIFDTFQIVLFSFIIFYLINIISTSFLSQFTRYFEIWINGFKIHLVHSNYAHYIIENIKKMRKSTKLMYIPGINIIGVILFYYYMHATGELLYLSQMLPPNTGGINNQKQISQVVVNPYQPINKVSGVVIQNEKKSNFCTNCGVNLEKNSLFCGNCGKKNV